MSLIEPLAAWERELLELGPAVDVEHHAERYTPERLPEPVNEPAKTYRIVDLALRTEIAGGLPLGDAWRLVDFLKGQDPLLRLDIRTEF